MRTPPSPTPTDTVATDHAGSDYAELSRRVRQAGLLDRRPGYYVGNVARTAALYLGGWALFVALGTTWWQLLTAVVLGIAFTQVGFLGHDVGHKQVFRTRRGAYVFGLVAGNLAIGLSYGWWVDKHSRHHAHPNDLERDPDVRPGVIVFSPEHARLRDGLGRRLAAVQSYLFFPLLTLEAMHLHVSSVRSLGSAAVRSRRLEGGLLLAHALGYLTLVLLVLPPWHALAFVAVQQAVFGLYLGVSFAPNHKGMPLERPEYGWDYLRRQVLTSRNVRGSAVVDWALGGLNYQVEHHLFPSMPRPSLRRAQPIVRAYCAELAIPYVECGLLASYASAIGYLDAVGRDKTGAEEPDRA